MIPFTRNMKLIAFAEREATGSYNAMKIVK